MPMQEGWRVAPEIDGHIQHLPSQATHHFCFGIWWMLKMQAAHRASLAREGVVDLGDRFINASRSEFLGAIKTRQEAAMVFYRLALHQHQPG